LIFLYIFVWVKYGGRGTDPGFSSISVGGEVRRTGDTLQIFFCICEVGRTGDRPWIYFYISVGDEVRRTGDTPWIFFYISFGVDVRRTGKQTLYFTLYTPVGVKYKGSIKDGDWTLDFPLF